MRGAAAVPFVRQRGEVQHYTIYRTASLCVFQVQSPLGDKVIANSAELEIGHYAANGLS